MRVDQQRDPPPRGAGWEPTALRSRAKWISSGTVLAQINSELKRVDANRLHGLCLRKNAFIPWVNNNSYSRTT